MPKYNMKNKILAQNLRRSMTPEERHLWYDFLRKLPITVKRQQPIGNYIVDFYVPSQKCVIELDGEQHYTVKNQLADKQRDEYLAGYGITVIRYTNKTVNDNFNGVCHDLTEKFRIDLTQIKNT